MIFFFIFSYYPEALSFFPYYFPLLNHKRYQKHVYLSRLPELLLKKWIWWSPCVHVCNVKGCEWLLYVLWLWWKWFPLMASFPFHCGVTSISLMMRCFNSTYKFICLYIQEITIAKSSGNRSQRGKRAESIKWKWLYSFVRGWYEGQQNATMECYYFIPRRIRSGMFFPNRD